MMQVYMLYGAPTSGKGTICKLFEDKHVVSMGHLLRQHQLTDGANMVSSEIVNKLLIREIQSRQGVPFVILDGYPRTTDQIDFIKACPDIELTRFIHLTCRDETVLYRTSLREVCLCGASYMPVLKPSKVVGICDLCGQQLFRRNDDDLKYVEQRLKIYHTQTPQIISAFKDIYLPIDMDDNDCFKRACRILAASDKNFEFLKNKEIIRM